MMAYASWSVVFGEQPSAAKWNILGTNDASFNDGTGIAGLYRNLLSVDSNPYKFRARRVSALSTTGGSFAKVTFDTEDFDTNSNFDSSTNNRYVAPVNGFYQFNASATTNGSPGAFYTMALYKNGSVYQRGGELNASGSAGVGYADFIQATAADFFEIYIFATSTIAYEVTAGAQPFFSGGLQCRT
jgi:hypothetical protein